MQKGGPIWMDGRLVPWDEARVHVLTHTLHYGLGVFEGIRFYRQDDGRSAVFRLSEHVRRLFESGRVVLMDLPYSQEAIREAILETCRKSGVAEGYIRPLAYYGDEEMGLYAPKNTVHVSIAVWSWGTYLGEDGLKNGIRMKTSSFTRFSVNALLARAKVCGHYVNSILAKVEAKRAGYDEALLLDHEGYVAEATGENLFAVRDGELLTPPLTAVLRGITRETVLALAREAGELAVRETRLTRDDLYLADEAFLTGTAAEITPIREVDDRTIGAGKPGPVTARLQKAFFDIVHGRLPKYHRWLTVV